ncbi:MAG: membrane dipeptidase [Deltaproteobacteria bacterium]|nr:membrane dipeptidase [Deltaproteobacteria bacterium]
MCSLASPDHRSDPAAWARRLGIAREAVELYLASDVIDLHVDSFIWKRLGVYDPTQRHGSGLFDARFYSHTDLPRLREARVTGALWVITTNPFRSAAGRAHAFTENLRRLRDLLVACPGDVLVARTAADYAAARAADKHAAFIAVQGGNAFGGDAATLERAGDAVVLVTLVHLSTSPVGTSSFPVNLRRGEGLTPLGIELVRQLNAQRIFVDLAHINRRGFFDAVAAHDRSQPLVVSHTGVSGVHPHWRNVDDGQLRAVADTGGVVGVIYEYGFLGDGRSKGAALVVDHLQHVVHTVGEDHAALGSDWDGLITTPRDMPTCLELPRLVQLMLDRGFGEGCIRKILGGNFLRALGQLRGAA